MMIRRFEHFSLDLFKISKYWNKLANEEMKKYGLKGISFVYLLIISENPEGITAAQITEITERDKADVSRNIASFEELGIIVKSEGNNYRSLIKLTEKGTRIVKQVSRRAEVILAAGSRGISEGDREIMYECLDKIAENTEKMAKNRSGD